MTRSSYDLSIISDQEATDRLGVMAGEREEMLDQLEDSRENEWLFGRSENEIEGFSANRATIALDILALRKAQVALDRRVVEENRRLQAKVRELEEELESQPYHSGPGL
jgi:hypothetical protein